jgi:hypothetical protein
LGLYRLLVAIRIKNNRHFLFLIGTSASHMTSCDIASTGYELGLLILDQEYLYHYCISALSVRTFEAVYEVRSDQLIYLFRNGTN